MPEPSPDERFQKVLDFAKRQISEGKILIRFGPTGKLRFVVDKAALKAAFVGSDLDGNIFEQIFDNEISPLLEAIIRKGSEQPLQIPPPLFGDVSELQARQDRERVLRERAQLIENSLFNPELRARYLIKASSKHPRLRTSSWEVAKKVRLSTKEELLYPYTTLSFETLRPEADLGIFTWIIPELGRSEYLTFDCDEGDLDDLIQLLQEARAALKTPE